ncbi:MAG: MltA domain-containing protein [Burkholderiales bacterium]|nr:MltA domain-containing protein [Burkholderiales bacterium]
MVHHTMTTSSTRASKASSKIRPMRRLQWLLGSGAIVGMLGVLAGCASGPSIEPRPSPAVRPVPSQPLPALADDAPLPPALAQGRSRWVPVRWAELPGFGEDAIHEGWNALLRNCERPPAAFAPLCPEVRQLAIGEGDEQRAWLVQRLQPYRVEPLDAPTEGLLTSYYEPVYEARRAPEPGFGVPLYRTPVGFAARRPWYTRQQIDTLPEAQAALRGREIAWMADPIDAMMLHIQGSGRLRVREADGSERLVRVAFAGTNEQPYRSITAWLQQQGVTRVSPWPGATKEWAAQNPSRVNQLLWSNPRYVFFQEEALTPLDAAFGPRGAQGVALTPGRSIAVDPQSIPYGTPVWLASSGPAANLQRLVVAQDTGSAIVGAVRADYFAGTGDEAGFFAARVKQPLRLWVLWPRR